MGKIAKNVVFLVGVLIISSAVFYLISDEGELKDNLFERALDLLGEQLIARLPDNDKEAAAAKWQGFSEKAVKGEIPSDRVERVAVGILNATNSDQAFSLDDAEVLLSLAQNDLEPTEIRPLKMSEPISPQIEDMFAREVEFEREKNIEECNELGKELTVICEFNDKLQQAFEEDKEAWQNFAAHFSYRVDDGVKVSADVALKDNFHSKAYKHLDQKIEELQNKKIITWRDNFAKEMEQEKVRFKVQMDSLKIVLQAENLERLKELKKLERLHSWQVLKAEEIEKVVTESLKGTETNSKIN